MSLQIYKCTQCSQWWIYSFGKTKTHFVGVSSVEQLVSLALFLPAVSKTWPTVLYVPVIWLRRNRNERERWIVHCYYYFRQDNGVICPSNRDQGCHHPTWRIHHSVFLLFAGCPFWVPYLLNVGFCYDRLWAMAIFSVGTVLGNHNHSCGFCFIYFVYLHLPTFSAKSLPNLQMPL